ncbi:MAG TPA: transcriptional regulator, partial [Actinomycetota bacterium]
MTAWNRERIGVDAGLEYTPSIPDTLETVDQLGQADIKRRTFLKTALFAVAASIGPSRDWLLATLEEATSPTRKVTSDQIEAIRRMFGFFQELDVMRGGGHARQQLAAYLTSTVTPLLRSNDASTDAGRALYEAGAEQLYLIGWMAFDDGEHVLAQRYLIQALRLSHEARRPELGAHVLAGLSDQATLTGHPDQGLQLARAGRAGLRHGRSPACL